VSFGTATDIVVAASFLLAAVLSQAGSGVTEDTSVSESLAEPASFCAAAAHPLVFRSSKLAASDAQAFFANNLYFHNSPCHKKVLVL
jgi:hypothetical protein